MRTAKHAVVIAGGGPTGMMLAGELALAGLGKPGGFDITPGADRVQLIEAEYVGLWELPVLGEVTAPSALLIRPDGHVAWVGEGTHQGLTDALTTWSDRRPRRSSPTPNGRRLVIPAALADI